MAADAAGFYKCIDSKGDVIFTDAPLPGAKCETRRGDGDVISSEQGLPPPVEFTSQTKIAAIPGTNIYIVPDSNVDIFFHDGWWWRLWEGRWYHSRHHSSGWVHHESVPSFHAKIPPDWRNDYWKNGQHWKTQQIGSIQGLKPLTQRQGVQPKSPKSKQRETVKAKRQTRQQKREAVKSQGQTRSQEREAPQRSQP
jgi:hypothetical protein